MKSIKLYVTAFLGAILFSCDDNLDLAPVSQLNQNNFYQSESDYEQAVIALYSSLRNQYDDIVLFTDIRSDNTRPALSGSITTRSDFDDFSLLPDNGEIANRWNDSYDAINRANGILDRIDEASIPSKDRIKGEALFARSLVYFNLVRIYGSIPLIINEVTPAESLKIPQSPTSEIYDRIVADLIEAASLLPSSYNDANIGRATAIAANALLGKVHLTTGNYEEAIVALRKVTAEEPTNVALLPEYAAVFDPSNEYNKEIIFAIRWTNDGVNGNDFSFDYTQPQPDNIATMDLFDAFEDGDARRGVTIDTTASTVDALIYKYGADPDGLGESDWPVIRYSDVLLMLAEALNEQEYVANGEAFDLLNRVRTRAGLAALTSETVPDQASFRLAIEQERRVELASEGHRWFDLVRTGRYVSVMSAKGFNVQTFHEVFPIPENELLKINDPAILDQNTGY